VWTNSEVNGDSAIRQVEALGGHTVYSVCSGPLGYTAVAFSGEVYTWKVNASTGNIIGKPTEIVLSTNDNVTVRTVAAGNRHFLFYSTSLSEGPCVLGLGDNNYNQLLSESTRTVIPLLLPPLNGVELAQISCGGFHCAAVTGAD